MRYVSSTVFAAAAAYLASMAASIVVPTNLISEAKAQALEEIVVTARKREESLQEIPLSVTAFSGAELERGAYVDLEDVSMSTPGMQFNAELAGLRPGRLFSNIRFRGVEGSEFSSLQTAALFVDGVFALQSAQSLALTDLERVEIIKGPQAATFGRNSFAGAINYITSTPSLDEFKGKAVADFGRYEQVEVAASVEGPITDKMALRVGARLYNRGEMYTASDGGALGEQSTQSIYATLYAEPSDNFNIKARVYYQEDDDGPESVGFFVGRLNDSCTGTSRPGLDVDNNPITVMPTLFVCGKIAELGTPGAAAIDSNTSLFPQALALQGTPNLLRDNLLSATSFGVVAGPAMDEFGLERQMTRLSVQGEYTFDNDMTLNATLSYNESKAANVRDWDMTSVESWYVINPQSGEDKGFDIRLSSPADGRLRWMGGLNIYDQEFLTSSNGGIFLHVCGNFAGLGTPAFCDSSGIFPTAVDGGDFVEVSSVYGSISFDITDQFTIDVEGRYQSDKRSDGLTDFSETFKNFLPRVSLSFKANENVNLYFTGSRGVLPGVINSNILQCVEGSYTVSFTNPNTGMPDTSASCDQYRQELGGAFAPLTPDQFLDAFELGLKSTWLDGRLLLNVALYSQEWKDAPTTTSVTLVLDDNADGIPNGCVLNPAGDACLTVQPNFRQISTPGSSEYSGVEVETALLVNENWTISGNLTYNDNELTNFKSAIGSEGATLGTTNVRGNRASRFPEWSGSISSTYTGQLTSDWEWYVRGDVQFMGEAFAGTTNLSIIDSYSLVNARVGFEKEDVRVEIYVKNLLDEDAWRGGVDFTDFSIVGADTGFAGFDFNKLGIILLPQDLRTVGVRATIEF